MYDDENRLSVPMDLFHSVDQTDDEIGFRPSVSVEIQQDDVYCLVLTNVPVEVVPFPARFVDTGKLPLTLDSCLRGND